MYVNILDKLTPIIYILFAIITSEVIHMYTVQEKKPTLIFETTFLMKILSMKTCIHFLVFDYKRVLQKTKPKLLPPF